jgi:hypothetical protein
MLPRSVAVLPCHLGWRTLLKCNKTNHACLPACSYDITLRLLNLISSNKVMVYVDVQPASVCVCVYVHVNLYSCVCLSVCV